MDTTFDAAPVGLYYYIHQCCYDPKSRGYAEYGGRGIRMCPDWADKENGCAQFMADIPPRPGLNYRLSLIDQAAGFSPNNVAWLSLRAVRAIRRLKSRGVGEEDVQNILRMVHVEGQSTEAVSIGYPLSAYEVYLIAIGRAFRVAGYPYPEKLADHRTPEQIAQAEALPGKVVAFTVENGISMERLWFIVGRLKKPWGRKAKATKEKKPPKRGANERLILEAYAELASNAETSLTELEVIDRAIAIRGEPAERKARNNMKTNFIRAIKNLCRREILMSVDGKLSMYERCNPEDEKITSGVSA